MEPGGRDDVELIRRAAVDPSAHRRRARIAGVLRLQHPVSAHALSWPGEARRKEIIVQASASNSSSRGKGFTALLSLSPRLAFAPVMPHTHPTPRDRSGGL